MTKLRNKRCFSDRDYQQKLKNINKMIDQRKSKWVAVLLLLLALFFVASGVVLGQFPVAPTPQEPLSLSAMFIMGDSSVSCGHVSFFPSLFSQDSFLFPCNGSQPTLIPQLLAEKMGLPQISQFDSQNGTTDDLISGLNFGSSPATIITAGELGFLNQQLRQALETIQLLELELGREEVQELIKSSLFYLSFGKDDYINLFSSNFSDVRMRFGPTGFAQILVNQMVGVVKDLYNADARKILCMGIGPLGCSPRILYESHRYRVGSAAGDGHCVDEINEHIVQYNLMLSKRLSELSLELSDAEIVFCDVYSGMMEIITHPGRYGFEEVRWACCGYGMYGGRIRCISEEMVCDEPTTHVWWDFYDPTEAVNVLLADSIWSSQSLGDLCGPITVQQLAFM
ncbi:GDSL esterase/lipase At5g08460-like [Macadamia integrifolia]|uniref:GDSL esterase/lipase At5g08460-like n=1 Tax=Macadamia integrifolia TaxID=60698 RepID=UPI001C4F1DAD|nr:GDSL esterase/lipase At5g08460-like [Macadamia integrifolia]